MANVKTVKPDGSGDYTTLALWEDYADGQADPAQHAECDSSGDLGPVTIAGWASGGSATADDHCYIYTAAGHYHNGSKTAGAYIDSPANPNLAIDMVLDFCHINGIRLNGGGMRCQIRLTETNIIENIFAHRGTGLNSAGNGIEASSLTGNASSGKAVGHIIRNCVVDDWWQQGYQIGMSGNTGTTGSVTMLNCSTYSSGGHGIVIRNDSTGGCDLTIENCGIVTGKQFLII